MPRVRTLSPQTVAVLEVLSYRPADWLYGLEIAKLTELKSGSLYPILIRLAERGLLKSRWLEPAELGRPPRHAYQILPKGVAALVESSFKQLTVLKEAQA